jgi:hypothetical protein
VTSAAKPALSSDKSKIPSASRAISAAPDATPRVQRAMCRFHAASKTPDNSARSLSRPDRFAASTRASTRSPCATDQSRSTSSVLQQSKVTARSGWGSGVGGR